MATLRMQVRHWRALVWVATVGLAGFAGWNLWKIIQNHRNQAYEPRDVAVFEALISNAIGSIDQADVKTPHFDTDYGKVVSCPINGYVPKKVEPVKLETTVEALPPEKPIGDVLKITAVSSAPGDAGRVVVKYKDDTVKPIRDEMVLKVGAMLTFPYDGEPYNGRLKQIKVDSAVFDWCGKDVEIRPTRKEDVAKEATATGPEGQTPFDSSLTSGEAEELAKHKSSKTTVKLPNDAGYVIGTDDYKELAHDADGFLREARLQDVKDANGKKELAVGNIRPKNKLAQTYDVQTGDVLVSINGQAVSNRAQATNYVREHQDLSKYVVVIRRKGREVTKTILVNRDK